MVRTVRRLVRSAREPCLHLAQLVQDAVSRDGLAQIELPVRLGHTPKEDALPVLFHHHPRLSDFDLVVVRILYSAKARFCLVGYFTGKSAGLFVFQIHHRVCEDAFRLFSLDRIAVGVVDEGLLFPPEPCLCARLKHHIHRSSIYFVSHKNACLHSTFTVTSSSAFITTVRPMFSRSEAITPIFVLSPGVSTAPSPA